MAHPNIRVPVAIDPLALVLPESIYVIYQEFLHPHVPVIDAVGRALANATPQERSFVLARAKSLGDLATEVAKTVAGGAKN